MASDVKASTTSPFTDPTLHRKLVDFVRRRVPQSDVDDVVQTVLVEALAAKERPTDATELTKWVLGIARHKVVDFHRRALRELAAEIPDIEASPPPVEERELARWAEEQAGSTRDAQRTLEWMAREGEGEKLESIADEEKIPAARVRQRVSRMRRWMKERWLAELAAVAALTALALAAWWLLRSHDETPEAKPDKPTPSSTFEAPPPPPPMEMARRMREDALKSCDRGFWQACLDGLDKAATLDPAGDAAPEVGAARAKAKDALAPAPTVAPSASSPDPGPSVAPTTTKLEDLSPKKVDLSTNSDSDAPAPKAKSKPTPKPVSTGSVEKQRPTKSGKSKKDATPFLDDTKAGTGTGAK